MRFTIAITALIPFTSALAVRAIAVRAKPPTSTTSSTPSDAVFAAGGASPDTLCDTPALSTNTTGAAHTSSTTNNCHFNGTDCARIGTWAAANNGMWILGTGSKEWVTLRREGHCLLTARNPKMWGQDGAGRGRVGNADVVGIVKAGFAGAGKTRKAGGEVMGKFDCGGGGVDRGVDVEFWFRGV